MTNVHLTAALMALSMLSAPEAIAGQAGTDAQSEKAAIVATALDYAEGYYSGEPQRMARAVSPYLSKRGLMTRPGVPPFLMQMNADTLIDASNGVKLAPAERHITTEVLHVNHEVASARVFTAQFNDYLHLVKRNGAWQILNVLWRPPSPSAPTADGARAGVEEAVRNYVAALLASDGPRAMAVVHPMANLRALAQPPQGRPRVVREQNPETLHASLAAGQAKLAGKPEDAQVTVEGVDVNIAAVRMSIGPMTTYLHLASTDGTWRVVNALAYPPSPGPPTR
jgi:hypothetical protein